MRREVRALLFGRQAASFTGRIVVVTDRGVEIPIDRETTWTVIDLTRTLAQIEKIPEIDHPLGANA